MPFLTKIGKFDFSPFVPAWMPELRKFGFVFTEKKSCTIITNLTILKTLTSEPMMAYQFTKDSFLSFMFAEAEMKSLTRLSKTVKVSE